jgi:hypothetical protein
MNNPISEHLPYAQLPLEARFLFFLFSFGTSPDDLSSRPTLASTSAILAGVWDSHRLTTGDLAQPKHVTALIRRHIASSVADAFQYGVEER